MKTNQSWRPNKTWTPPNKTWRPNTTWRPINKINQSLHKTKILEVHIRPSEDILVHKRPWKSIEDPVILRRSLEPICTTLEIYLHRFQQTGCQSHSKDQLALGFWSCSKWDRLLPVQIQPKQNSLDRHALQNGENKVFSISCTSWG